MERSRKQPQKVEVHYYPKGSGARPSRAQTIPELELPHETITESGEETPHVSKRRTRTAERTPVPAYDDMIQLGHELFVAGRINDARIIFEGLIAAGLHDAFAFTMLGTICLSLKDWARAEGLFDQALALDPSDLPALVYRGEVRLKRKKAARAVKDFEQAVKLGEPADPFVERARRLLALAKKAARG